LPLVEQLDDDAFHLPGRVIAWKVFPHTRIYTILNGRKKPGEVYLAAIAPDMELTIITLDEVPASCPALRRTMPA